MRTTVVYCFKVGRLLQFYIFFAYILVVQQKFVFINCMRSIFVFTDTNLPYNTAAHIHHFCRRDKNYTKILYDASIRLRCPKNGVHLKCFEWVLCVCTLFCVCASFSHFYLLRLIQVSLYFWFATQCLLILTLKMFLYTQYNNNNKKRWINDASHNRTFPINNY